MIPPEPNKYFDNIQEYKNLIKQSIEKENQFSISDTTRFGVDVDKVLSDLDEIENNLDKLDTDGLDKNDVLKNIREFLKDLRQSNNQLFHNVPYLE